MISPLGSSILCAFSDFSFWGFLLLWLTPLGSLFSRKISAGVCGTYLPPDHFSSSPPGDRIVDGALDGRNTCCPCSRKVVPALLLFRTSPFFFSDFVTQFPWLTLLDDTTTAFPSALSSLDSLSPALVRYVATKRHLVQHSFTRSRLVL